MGYASVEAARTFVGRSSEVRIIRTEERLGVLVNVIQTVSVETYTYKGLNSDNANKLASAYDSSTNPTGLVKTNLGGVKVTVTDAIGASAWFSVFSCRGMVETAQSTRVGDSGLFNVTYTKQVLTVTADNGTVTNI